MNRTLKVLLLSKYDNLGASSRMRSYQYLPYLRKKNISVVIEPLFDNKYIKDIYNKNKKPYYKILKSYIKRLITLLKIHKYDVIWIEKEILPWLPSGIEQILNKLNISYLVDYDDAIFHNYDQNSNFIIRKLLDNKIDKVMKNSTVVTAGNKYIAQKAEKSGAANIEVIPTVIDLNKYKITENNYDKFTIGWIGTPSTIDYLNNIATVFNKFLNSSSQLVIIGSEDFKLNNKNIIFKEWSEETEIMNLNNIDVGIMPLTDDPWSRGKCGYKLIQYMACQKPVIASPVGANKDIVDHNYNGFLASDENEWIKYLKRLKENKDLRVQLGKKGRKKVENNYSLQVAQKKLYKIFNNYF
jgi:glycosyltransferase involved in cell wall biosynthesis